MASWNTTNNDFERTFSQVLTDLDLQFTLSTFSLSFSTSLNRLFLDLLREFSNVLSDFSSWLTRNDFLSPGLIPRSGVQSFFLLEFLGDSRIGDFLRFSCSCGLILLSISLRILRKHKLQILVDKLSTVCNSKPKSLHNVDGTKPNESFLWEGLNKLAKSKLIYWNFCNVILN